MAFSPARGLGLARLSPASMTGGLPRMTATLDEKSSAVEASLERLATSSSMDPALMAVVGLQEGVATYDRDANPSPSPNPSPSLSPNPSPLTLTRPPNPDPGPNPNHVRLRL